MQINGEKLFKANDLRGCLIKRWPQTDPSLGQESRVARLGLISGPDLATLTGRWSDR